MLINYLNNLINNLIDYLTNINNSINYLTYILFLIPFTLLIVDHSVLFPFITTKALIFRGLVSLGLILGIWLYLLTDKSFQYLKKNFLLIGTLLFFLANSISTIFSINPYRSFWGNAERMEGLWSLFFYLSYFFLLITLFQFEPKAKKTIFYSILIVTTIISLIEINQVFFQKQERPSATLGNATYIGFMNLLTIFLILYFLFEEKFQITNLKTIFYSLLIVINLLSLIGSQTRGSILGLLVGIFLGAIFYITFAKISFKKKFLIFSLFLLFLVGFYFFLKTGLALQVPGIKRIAETLQNPISVFPRLFAWKIFFNAFKQKPVFGWGPESEPIAFFSAFDPRIFNYEQAIFDRPHNKFVEILVKTGVFGFISWLFLIGTFVYYIYIKRKQNLLQAISLFSFLTAYLGQSVSLFDMQASYLLFFFGLSLVVEKIDFKLNKEKFIRPYLILISGISLIFIVIHVQHYYLVRKIITYLRTPDPKIASQGFLRISEIAGPFLTEEAVMVSNYVASHAQEIKNLNDFLNFYAVVDLAYSRDQKDYRLNMIYINHLILLINIKEQIGLKADKDIDKVKEIYQNLLKNYPKMPEIYINYANFLYGVADDKELALKILTEGENNFLNIYPRYLLEEGYLLLIYRNNKLAYQKLNLALEKKFNFRYDEDFEKALKIYLANDDVENSKKIIALWQSQNKSKFIKEKIRQILENYNYSQLIKLDK